MKKMLLLLCMFISIVSLGQTKVTGGFEIPIESAPWQILLRSNGKLVCGGIIIGDRWILTARHCTDGNPKIDIIYGITSKNEITASKTISVKRK